MRGDEERRRLEIIGVDVGAVCDAMLCRREWQLN
jgi:hypothetical protein